MLPPTTVTDNLLLNNIHNIHSTITTSPYFELLSRGGRGGGGLSDAPPPSEEITLSVLLGGFLGKIYALFLFLFVYKSFYIISYE